MQSEVGNKRLSEIEAKPIEHKLKRRIIKRTQYVEVDVCRIRSRNAVEHSLSRSKVIQSLTRSKGTRYNVILFKMGVVGKI